MWTIIREPRWFSPMAGTAALKLRNMKNIGIVSASMGTICATSRITSSLVRHRNRKRVSATDAKNAHTIAPVTETSATRMEFIR